jgi:hypothetical protein
MIERCCLAVLATGSQMDATLTYYPTFSSGEMVVVVVVVVATSVAEQDLSW